MFTRILFLLFFVVSSASSHAVMRPDLWSEEAPREHHLVQPRIEEKTEQVMEVLNSVTIPVLPVDFALRAYDVPPRNNQERARRTLDLAFYYITAQFYAEALMPFRDMYFYDENVEWSSKGLKTVELPVYRGEALYFGSRKFNLSLPVYAAEMPLMSRWMKLSSMVHFYQVMQRESIQGPGSYRHEVESIQFVSDLTNRVLDHFILNALPIDALKKEISDSSLGEREKDSMMSYIDEATASELGNFSVSLFEAPPYDVFEAEQAVELFKTMRENINPTYPFEGNEKILGVVKDAYKRVMLKSSQYRNQPFRWATEAKRQGDFISYEIYKQMGVEDSFLSSCQLTLEPVSIN